MALKEILTKTINGVFRKLKIDSKTIEEKYNYIGKYTPDKRRRVYEKKKRYYYKENFKKQLKIYKEKGKEEEYKRLLDDYNAYVENQQIKERQEQQREKREKQTTITGEQPTNYVRAWLKMRYNDLDTPLFIEAFLDGAEGNEQEMRTRLLEMVASNFNDGVAANTEIGFERIKKPEHKTPFIKYKHNLIGGWNRL